jgi:catechol 2,3-dioxygenase-like lactoylglutathione lyase family enzyme
MSSTQMSTEHATQVPTAAAVDLKLEVVVIPVSDVDRAKRFYQSLGWRLDADFSNGQDWHLVQMTPPGSPCSVMFGKGFTTAAPGSVQGTFLVVDDVEAAREELVRHGVDVSEVFHFDGNLLRVAGTKGRVPGPDPEGRSYFSFATFSDPDGNSWLLQAVTSRLPGRGFCERRKRTTAVTRRPLRSTTGRTGTPRTSSRASAGGLPKRQPRMAQSIWKKPADEG